MIKASVVICTRNRLDDLKESLDLVLKQNYKNFEVIVVDNASDTQDVSKYIKKIRSKRVKYVLAPKKPNLPYARNVGIRNAKGEIIAFIDDDSLVSKNWLSEAIKSFYLKDVGAVAGRVKVPKNSDLFEVKYLKSKGLKRFLYEIFALFLDYYGKPASIKKSGQVVGFFDYDKFIEVDHAWGCNMIYRKSALLKAGLFDENYENYPLREDTDMCVRIKRLGYKILFNPKAKVFHKLTRKGKIFSRMNFYYRNKHHIYFVFKNKLVKGLDGWLKFILQQFAEIFFFLFYSISIKEPTVFFQSLKGKLDGFKIALRF